MKKQFLILSIFAALLLSIFFVSCEDETSEKLTHAGNIDSEVFNTKGIVEPPETITPYYYSDGSFSHCDNPTDGGCHYEIIILPDPGGKSENSLESLFSLLDSNASPESIAAFVKNNTSLDQYINREFLLAISKGDCFLKHKVTEEADYLLGLSELNGIDEEDIVYAKKFQTQQ